MAGASGYQASDSVMNNLLHDSADFMRDPADIISSHLDQQLEFDRLERETQQNSMLQMQMHGVSGAGI